MQKFNAATELDIIKSYANKIGATLIELAIIDIQLEDNAIIDRFKKFQTNIKTIRLDLDDVVDCLFDLGDFDFTLEDVDEWLVDHFKDGGVYQPDWEE